MWPKSKILLAVVLLQATVSCFFLWSSMLDWFDVDEASERVAPQDLSATELRLFLGQFPASSLGKIAPISNAPCLPPEERLCGKKQRRTVTWFIVSPPFSELIGLWFDRLSCAIITCPTWNYFQAHYCLDELSREYPSVQKSIEALSGLTANFDRPGPHLWRVDYKAGTYMYKRPKVDWNRYERYARQTAAKFADTPTLPLPMDVPRIIWMVWFQGIDDLIQNHTRDPRTGYSYLQGWMTLNPSWDIRVINSSTIEHWAPISAQVYEQEIPGRKMASKSDMIRLEVLYRYGGVWADMSVLPMYPLDHWLPKELEAPDRNFLTYVFTPPED